MNLVPLYILGLLQRFGPQHGYQIKKIINEQLSDFTQIKLPTIYYHLEGMAAGGLLEANSETAEKGSEKTVYSITEKGKESFHSRIKKLLNFNYQPVFESDAVFFFADYLNTEELPPRLDDYIGKLKKTIAGIEAHKTEMIESIPEEMREMAAAIFSHHEYHYRAELEWAAETLKSMNQGGYGNDEKQNSGNKRRDTE